MRRARTNSAGLQTPVNLFKRKVAFLENLDVQATQVLMQLARQDMALDDAKFRELSGVLERILNQLDSCIEQTKEWVLSEDLSETDFLNCKEEVALRVSELHKLKKEFARVRKTQFQELRNGSTLQRAHLFGTRSNNPSNKSGENRAAAPKPVVNRSQDAALLQAENNVQVLRRVRDRMSGQVETLRKAAGIMKEDNEILKQTDLEYKNFDSVFGLAKSVLSNIRRRDLTDRALIVFALLFFCLTVVYIVKKRLGF